MKRIQYTNLRKEVVRIASGIAASNAIQLSPADRYFTSSDISQLMFAVIRRGQSR